MMTAATAIMQGTEILIVLSTVKIIGMTTDAAATVGEGGPSDYFTAATMASAIAATER